MGDCTTLLEILLDTLNKKRDALKLIKEMTDKQAEMIKQNKFDEGLFANLIKMKQTKIDQVKVLDDGFVATYDRVKVVLLNQPALYGEQVVKMQGLIREIGELGISIQVEERRNKRLLDIHEASKPMLKEDVVPGKQLSRKRIDAYTVYDKKKE